MILKMDLLGTKCLASLMLLLVRRKWRQIFLFIMNINIGSFACKSQFPVERIKRATINPYNPIASKNTNTIRKRTLQIGVVMSDS
jgi:hypothetical protein